MKIANVWLEHPVMELNKTFSYYLKQDMDICKGVRVKIELNNKIVVGFVDSVQDFPGTKQDFEKQSGFEIKPVLGVMDEQSLINDELYDLAIWMSKNTISPVISCFNAMLPSKMKPASSAKDAAVDVFVRVKDASKAITSKQQQALEKLNGVMMRSEYRKCINPSMYTKLLQLGCIETFEEEKKASVEDLVIHEAGYPLTDIQKQAISAIETSSQQVILLHGLTGSGKTEIYMQLAAKQCRQGKQVLILVPEISLTPQMVKRMTSRFGANIAIYHSHLNDQQRYEQYQLVKNKKVKIVVGTRSAIFMPFDHLGLIVLDEEHDHSYKQDKTPRYNCRDIAVYRAQKHGCKVVLGSATPTLESYARALKGVYGLVTLNKRIHQNLPASHLIDMQKQIRKGNYLISEDLKKALIDRYVKHEQSILLLNRRGYTPIMRCSHCGYTVVCPHCDIAMSYHKDSNLLMCHTCGTTMSPEMDCPKCGDHSWRNYGLGTQRLMEEVQKLVPEARILRMDADTTKVKEGHEKILSQFEQHEADILIGTQMIAKGLDYPDVTLVGIFNADALLARADYRSVETTFNLIVQASGRSGRGHTSGEVYVQAYDCQHYGIRLAVQQDYISFFKNEMEYRHMGNYPPYCYLCCISFSSRNEAKAKLQAKECAEYFKSEGTLKVLGPSELVKKMDDYRYRVVLKGKDNGYLKEVVYQWFTQLSVNKTQMNIQIDIDPYVLD